MKIHMELGANSYDIVVERGSLHKCATLLNLNRKVFIITDSGIPTALSEAVRAQCREGYISTVAQGEASKSISVYEKLLGEMLSLGFSRGDCVVAVGGGVVGDLSGFVAASYMRGVDFYNIPTTVLSQIDSSIGGKVAVNLGGIKNIVGAFYQPKKVVIDPDVLATLPKRQISNGLAEAVKMSLTSDEELFSIFEQPNPTDRIDEIIIKSLMIKKSVVEQDEKESGLRKILNFGHTIGHAVESEAELKGLYHGECVALGMIPMCSPEVRKRLIRVLKSLSLPIRYPFDEEKALKALTHDKKSKGNMVTAVYVEKAGSFKLKDIPCESLKSDLGLICER